MPFCLERIVFSLMFGSQHTHCLLDARPIAERVLTSVPTHPYRARSLNDQVSRCVSFRCSGVSASLPVCAADYPLVPHHPLVLDFIFWFKQFCTSLRGRESGLDQRDQHLIGTLCA